MSETKTARCDAITFQDLLAQETVPVPPHLREDRGEFLGSDDIPASHYTAREFHEHEKQAVWPRVWQLACRLDDIPDTGNYFVHDSIDDSVIVVRDHDGSVKAYTNACLHRGRALKQGAGSCREFKCPFHGFTWNLDGSFKGMPCSWDFEHLKAADLTLPSVRVDHWGGFVFVNLDGKAPPLLDYLGPLPSHFERYKLENAFTAVHVQRRIPCNWKLAHEAFMESWHTVVVHPQILSFTADANTQYDILHEHVTRMITPMSVPSPHKLGMNEEDIMRDILESSGRMAESSAEGKMLPEGQTARQFIAEMNRQAFAEASGEDLSDATMAELQDAMLYDVFPNIQIWAGYNGNIVYQFRPAGDDHEHCIFDVRILMKSPPGGDAPRAVTANRLADDQPFTEAPELGALGGVFEQDMNNLPFMMKGLKASTKGAISLGNYQEIRIRHLHQRLQAYIAEAT